MRTKRFHLGGVAGVLVVIIPFLMVTASPAIEVLTDDELTGKGVVKKRLVKTADNAIILFDASAAMEAKFLDPNMSRYDIARKFLKERNADNPDLGYNFGLYLYTPWTPVYPMQAYDRDKFAKALDSLPAEPGGGPKELQKALIEIEPVLKGLSGKTVVFIYTDGRYTKTPDALPEALAEELANKYPVCFYIVSTADDWGSNQVAQELAPGNFCSRVIRFEDFMNRPYYNTGALYTVAAEDTADNILFEFDKSDILSQFHGKLKEYGEFLQRNPNTFAVVSGYSDNSGTEEYNGRLSRQRAENVAAYLATNFGIANDRLVTNWFGMANPVADNGTEEGRQLNRRVEIAVGGQL